MRKYSHNWAFMQSHLITPTGSTEGPMMKRYRLIRTPLFGVFLHRIYRADVDREVHDHPWCFTSFILRGSYIEQVAELHEKTATIRYKRHWRRFSVHRMPIRKAHYITKVNGKVLTLVFVGRRKQDWGFYPGSGYVPWREFTSAGGVNPGPNPFDE